MHADQPQRAVPVCLALRLPLLGKQMYSSPHADRSSSQKPCMQYTNSGYYVTQQTSISPSKISNSSYTVKTNVLF